MKHIDTRGLSCPVPVIEVKSLVDQKIESFSIVVDFGAPYENVKRFLKVNGYNFEEEPHEDGIKIRAFR